MSDRDWREVVARSDLDAEAAIALIELEWAQGPEQWHRFQDQLLDLMSGVGFRALDAHLGDVPVAAPHLFNRLDDEDALARGFEKLGRIVDRLPED